MPVRGPDGAAHVAARGRGEGDLADPRHLLEVLAQGGTDDDPSVARRPSAIPRMLVSMSNCLRIWIMFSAISMSVVEREQLAGAECGLADREDCSLDDAPVVIGAASFVGRDTPRLRSSEVHVYSAYKASRNEIIWS